jgi:flagellar biosynthesis anti-sigma factor FlgM
VTTIHHGLDSNLAGIGSGSTDKTKATQGQAVQAQTPALSGATPDSGAVDITPTAQLLANVAQQISDAPDIDHSRVDSIRQALSTGAYQINSSQVADGLLAAQRFDAQAMAGTPSQTAKAFADTAQLGSDAG